MSPVEDNISVWLLPPVQGLWKPSTDLDRASEWCQYRDDYGVSREHMDAAHKAFYAGWEAARSGSQGSALT